MHNRPTRHACFGWAPFFGFAKFVSATFADHAAFRSATLADCSNFNYATLGLLQRPDLRASGSCQLVRVPLELTPPSVSWPRFALQPRMTECFRLSETRFILRRKLMASAMG